MTSSVNDNRAVPLAFEPARFEPLGSSRGRAFDWAEELTERPRRFAPRSRFYGDDPLIAALWWAARRHARPECFLGWDDQLVADMRPRLDAQGGLYLEGAQLNAFLDHLTERADGDLRTLVYLRPHPENPARSVLQAAISAMSRPGPRTPIS